VLLLHERGFRSSITLSACGAGSYDCTGELVFMNVMSSRLLMVLMSYRTVYIPGDRQEYRICVESLCVMVLACQTNIQTRCHPA